MKVRVKVTASVQQLQMEGISEPVAEMMSGQVFSADKDSSNYFITINALPWALPFECVQELNEVPLLPAPQKVDGGVKHDGGKADFTYLEYVGNALGACCKVWEGGFIKYGERGGWKRVENAQVRYKAALLRHALDYPAKGEEFDKELSEILGEDVLHKACVAVNALMDLQLELEKRQQLAGA